MQVFDFDIKKLENKFDENRFHILCKKKGYLLYL